MDNPVAKAILHNSKLLSTFTMASGAEPSSSAGVTQAMMEMRLSERLQREAEDEA